jgi:hypothetical protein
MAPAEWKPCPGYEGIYEVSRDGRFRRIEAARGSRVGYELRGLVDGRGYRTFTLRKNGRFRSEKSHRLVCEAFHGQAPAGKSDVNHKDRDKLNNLAENLEWCSRSENIKHMFTVGEVRMENRSGSKHPKARPVARVAKDGTVTVFETIKDACTNTPNARRDRVWAVLSNRLQTHAGFGWRNP